MTLQQFWFQYVNQIYKIIPFFILLNEKFIWYMIIFPYCTCILLGIWFWLLDKPYNRTTGHAVPYPKQGWLWNEKHVLPRIWIQALTDADHYDQILISNFGNLAPVKWDIRILTVDFDACCGGPTLLCYCFLVRTLLREHVK